MHIPSDLSLVRLKTLSPVVFQPPRNNSQDQTSQLLHAFQKFERNMGFTSDIKDDVAFAIQSAPRDQLKHAFYQLEESFSACAFKAGCDYSGSILETGLNTTSCTGQGDSISGNSNMNLDSDMEDSASFGSQDTLSSAELQYVKELITEIEGLHIRDENLKKKVSNFKLSAESILNKAALRLVDHERYTDGDKIEQTVISASALTRNRKPNTKNTVSTLASWRNYLLGHKAPLNIKPLGMTTSAKSSGSNFNAKADL